MESEKRAPALKGESLLTLRPFVTVSTLPWPAYHITPLRLTSCSLLLSLRTQISPA